MDNISKPDLPMEEWLEAAERGDTKLVVDHLKSGMDVNGGNLIDTTALMRAVRGGQIEMIRVLLDYGADLSIVNSLGYTAMTYAVLYSRSWGIWTRPFQPDPRPLELLLAVGGRYQLREAVLLNDLELARARLDEGADVDTGDWTYNGPMLKIAAELGYFEIVELLLDRGANIEAVDDLGQRALMSAARYGRTEVVRLLLDRGADINAVNWCEQSALSNSAIEGHDELFDLLLSRGAQRGIIDALVRNEIVLFETLFNKRPLADSDIDWLSVGGVRIAMLAAGRGNVEVVRLLLDRGAAHFKKWCDTHTLLAEAARCGHIDVVQLLIERGADLHAVAKDGLTPLAWAIREGQDGVASVLKRAGAVR